MVMSEKGQIGLCTSSDDMSVPVLCGYKAEQLYSTVICRSVSGETSTLFRNEDSGEMHGLTRVRFSLLFRGTSDRKTGDQMVKEFKDCIALAQYCSAGTWC